MADNPTNVNLAERLRSVQVGLRSDLEVSRHTFRGEPSYVVRNPITFQSHNLSLHDYQILVALNNEKDLGDVFAELLASGRLNQSQEEEFYAFVLNLQQLGLLNLPVSDGKALYKRFKNRQVSQRRANLTGFLFWRVPLFNPDAMLDRTMRYVAPLFSRTAFVLWIILMVVCAGILTKRWDDFKEPLQTILVAKNLLGMWILLVTLKVVHEFGHAYICKRFGGKVPEMGAFFVCMTPCAYVDASASWGFASKRERIAVSLGGMYVESMVACIALLVWNATGPSMLNSFAHQTVTLASIVTIVFNINPLMRYDGYYILSDLVEIPNLRERSAAQVKMVCKRFLLGVRSEVLPFSFSGRVLLFVYGLCSSVWKVFLVTAICTGIALKIYVLGALIGAFYAITVLWGMLSKFVSYLWMSPETDSVRYRAIALGMLVIVGIPLGLTTIPIYMPIQIQGVVAAASETPIYAPAAGFLRTNPVKAGQEVEVKSLLYVLDNAQIHANAKIAKADYDISRLKAQSVFEQDPSGAAMTRRRAEHLGQVLHQSQRDVENLSTLAPVAGKVVDCDNTLHAGRFVKEGERVATITSGGWTVRALTTAEGLADIKPRVGQKVRVRLSGLVSEELTGTIAKVAVTGSPTIPMTALTQLGGGTIAVDPSTMNASEPFFEITIDLDPAETNIAHRGMSVFISCSAQPQTVGVRLYRSGLRFLNLLRS